MYLLKFRAVDCSAQPRLVEREVRVGSAFFLACFHNPIQQSFEVKMANIHTSNLVLFSATICCFGALYTEFPDMILLSGQDECLCMEGSYCLKVNTPIMPVAFTTGNGYWCKFSFIFFSIALKPPKVLCQGKNQYLCCVHAMAFPPNDEVPIMCAICFVDLYPRFGVFKTVGEASKPKHCFSKV